MSLPKKPVPYAVALFYQPSIAAALVAGVKLPQTRLTLLIPYNEGVEAGVLIPLSRIHVDPKAPPPDAPPPNATGPPTHKQIGLPITIFESTSAIHLKNFEIAEAFVRIQDYDPLTMVIPDPAPGMSTAGVVYGAEVIKAKEGLNKLHSVKVRRLSELESVLNTRDGPLLVEILELDSLQVAPDVYHLVKDKKEQGWACWPPIKVLNSLACIASKVEDVRYTSLPRLRSQLRNRRRAAIVKRRMKTIKEHLKSVRRKVHGNVIKPGICGEIWRAISRVHAKVPKRTPSYLMRRIDEWKPLLDADLSRPIVFVE